MKILKNSIIISSYVLLALAFFFGGYAAGKRPENRTVMNNSEEVKEVEAVTPLKSIYYLVIEDDALNLYNISNGERLLVASEVISENIYPSEDIRELKNGVTFDNIEDAQALFENFVS